MHIRSDRHCGRRTNREHLCRSVSARPRLSDSGVTLMELMVGMVIMTIFMAMFTGAVVMMFNATSKAQAIGDTASQLSIAFNRLDKSVRYASAITAPGSGDGDGNLYVEWESTFTGTPVCTQLRFNVAAGQLQQRTWTVTTDAAGISTGYSNASAWLPLASSLKQGNASDPAVLTRIGGSALPYQQLRIYLIAEAIGRTGPTQSVSDVTFTAFNSSPSSPGDVCEELGRS